MSLVRKENYYETLGLQRNASTLEIVESFERSKTFWEQLKSEHLTVAEEKIFEITNAYSTLIDPVKRNLYNETLDYEFVLLDGKPIDEDMEFAYVNYQQNQRKSYPEVLKEFQLFKKGLGQMLWLLKMTTAYFLFSLFLYSCIVLVLTFLWEQKEWEDSPIFIPSYMTITWIIYAILRKYYLIPKSKTKHNIPNQGID
ncbi:putative chaperone protein DnaJ [Leptospira ryugenii]|uniref:Putative chaperone protein DnaJ n=1 Tax=Leptospira ryugenii TaxID=1917863 RepID=A0A2P2DX39_9LEPT|nr:DnaJ domain-containing protein [Leptospira ryugenii]GBF49204.1 putative chaperone protein DnaJ [Leptospira ryugenii]